MCAQRALQSDVPNCFLTFTCPLPSSAPAAASLAARRVVLWGADPRPEQLLGSCVTEYLRIRRETHLSLAPQQLGRPVPPLQPPPVPSAPAAPRRPCPCPAPPASAAGSGEGWKERAAGSRPPACRVCPAGGEQPVPYDEAAPRAAPGGRSRRPGLNRRGVPARPCSVVGSGLSRGRHELRLW